MLRHLLALALTLGVFFPLTVRAQSVPARDYLNTPVDNARFFLNLTNSAAVTAAESDVPVPNNETVVGSGYLSILYSYPIGGKYGGVAVSEGKGTVRVA